MFLFRKFKIYQKLWLLNIGLILAISLAFYFYYTSAIESQFNESQNKKGTAQVRAASSNLGFALYANNVPLIEESMLVLDSDPDVAFVYVADKNKQEKFGLKHQAYRDQIRRLESSNDHELKSMGLSIFKQSIFYQDEYQGFILVGLNTKWVHEKVAEQTRSLVLISFIFIVLLIVISFFVAKAISKPLNDAADVINEYSENGTRLNFRIPVKGRDEIAQLAKALNHLADNLDKKIKELNQSKKYIERLFELSPVPLVISDSMGNIEQVNASASSFFGIENSVLLQMSLNRFFKTDDQNAILNRGAGESDEIRGFVTTIRMTDGTKKIIELNISCHEDQINFSKSIIIAIIDVTEKIQIQRDILYNQTKLQKINTELTSKTNELEELSSWNKRNAHNLGQLISISQQLMRMDSPNQIMQRIIEDGSNLLEADESSIYFWDKKSSSLVPSASKPGNIFKRLHPVSENKNSFLWKSYQQNDTFVQNSLAMSSSDRIVLGINNHKEYSVVVVPISERDYRFGVLNFIKEGKDEIREEDVHLVSTLANQAAILLDNIRLVHAMKDKAESLENAVRDLQKSQQQVVQLQKMESLGTLVGGIAHDFNNILGIIIPNTDLLKNDAKGDPRILRRAGIINEASQRAADLTRQLLMFSRNQDVQLVLMNPNKFITRLINMLKRTIGKEYDVLMDLDPEIPAIKADDTRLTQVLINLAVNARDAMPDGGKIVIGTRLKHYKPRLEADSELAEYVCISISDEGVGIKPEYLDKIFDPFFTTKTVGKGTGLGLSVVYGIMQSHKGHVVVDSEPNKGTTFYLYLPPEETPVEIPESVNSLEPEGNENILVVDDESMIRESIREILSSFGYNVTTVSNGIDALKAVNANRNKFHLAIVDMSMPKMNGIDTIRGIRKLDSSVKVVLSSGHLEKNRALPQKIQLDGTLPKPYRLRDLTVKIREILNRNGNPKSNR